AFMNARRPARKKSRRSDIVNVRHLRRFTGPGKRAAAVLVAATACAAAAGCAVIDRGATDLAAKVELPPRPSVDVRVSVRPEHARQTARYMEAARATLTAYAARFGVMPFTSLTVVDPGWSRVTEPGADPAVVFAATRWLAPAGGMETELAVTRA